MENNETPKKKRIYKLKFDQLWVDAINQIPVYYHSEIYYWLDYYQNHNHSDLIGTIKDDLVRSLFMLIYPTIRRRRLARERQRRCRARKKAARLAAITQQPAPESTPAPKPAPKPKPAQPKNSQPQPVVQPAQPSQTARACEPAQPSRAAQPHHDECRSKAMHPPVREIGRENELTYRVINEYLY